MRDGYFWQGFKLQIDEMQLPCHLEENIVSVGVCVQQGIMVSHAQRGSMLHLSSNTQWQMAKGELPLASRGHG